MSIRSGVRPLVADLAAGALWRTGVSRPVRRTRDALTVVTLHRVLPATELARYPFPGLAVTPEELDWLVNLLSRWYVVGPLTESWDAHRSSEPTARPRLALTFDDGQWDNIGHAAPVLARAGVRATFYVPVDAVNEGDVLWHDRMAYALATHRSEGRDARPTLAEHGLVGADGGASIPSLVEEAKSLDPSARDALVTTLVDQAGPAGSAPEWGRLMTWDEIRQLDQAGHEIGSHSMSHELLPQLDADRVAFEVTRSREAIEEQIQKPVESFCYPNGSHDPTSRQAASAAGYRNAVTTAWGVNGRDADPYALARCDFDAARFRDRRGDLSPARTAMRLTGLQPGLG